VKDLTVWINNEGIMLT